MDADRPSPRSLTLKAQLTASLSPKARRLMDLGEQGLDRRHRALRAWSRRVSLGLWASGALAYALFFMALGHRGSPESHVFMLGFVLFSFLFLPGLSATLALDLKAIDLEPVGESGADKQAEAVALARVCPDARRLMELAASQGRRLRFFDLDEMRRMGKERQAQKARRDFELQTQKAQRDFERLSSAPQAPGDAAAEPNDSDPSNGGSHGE